MTTGNAELDNPFFARFYRRNRLTADKRGEREHRAARAVSGHPARRALHFYEHVHARRQPLRAVLEIADRSRVWPTIAGGCHPTRETAAAIAAAGFDIEQIDRFGFSPSLLSPRVPHMLGSARRP